LEHSCVIVHDISHESLMSHRCVDIDIDVSRCVYIASAQPLKIATAILVHIENS